MVDAHAASTSDCSAAFAVVRVRVVGSSVMVIATILPLILGFRLNCGIDGLQALRDREQSLDQWLRETVAPICDDIAAGRGTFMSPDEVYESIASELMAL